MPTRAWRQARGHSWGIGDTVNCGIGQGYVEVTPLALCTYVSRVATGRAVQPHLTRTLSGTMQPGVQPLDWPSMNLNERHLQLCREGMYAVVNDPGGTAPLARLNMPGMQLAGKTGSSQVRHVSRELREHGNFKSENLPWEYRPHALFVAFAPYDAPRYAVSLVVEHGNAGAAAAAPLARQIMVDTLTRDPVNRIEPQGQKLADRS
jgi:penicillin-binding protein 2